MWFNNVLKLLLWQGIQNILTNGYTFKGTTIFIMKFISGEFGCWVFILILIKILYNVL